MLDTGSTTALDGIAAYDPADWYWRKEDGSLFSSARVATVSNEDETFLQWTQAGLRTPTNWPRDEHGAETVGALQSALDPVGGHASLQHYASGIRYLVEVAGAMATVGGKSVLVSTARGEDRSALSNTMIAILAGVRQDGAAFKFADGGSRPVTNDEMKAAIVAAFHHVQAAFDLEQDVIGKIGSGKVKTIEQVDEIFALLAV